MEKEDLYLKFIFDEMWVKDNHMKEWVVATLSDFVDIGPENLSTVDLNLVAEKLKYYVMKGIHKQEYLQLKKEAFNIFMSK